MSCDQYISLTSMMMGGLPTRAMAVLSFLLFPPLQTTWQQC